MAITPPISEAPIGYTCVDLCTSALIEIGAVAPGETPAPEELQWVFSKANEVLDVWAALRRYVYSYNFFTETLVAGLSPHLMGPSPAATWYVPQRPVRIESAALLLNAPGSQVDIPINIRDKDWWALNQVKNIQTNVPTDLYYDPTFPDGSLYFWPVPNSQSEVRLQTWVNISQFASITDPIGGPGGPNTLPPAMRTALKLTLAESLLPSANREPNPILTAAATAARGAFVGNNAKPPRIQTQDAGMPKSRGARGDFSWATGGRPGGAAQ